MAAWLLQWRHVEPVCPAPSSVRRLRSQMTSIVALASPVVLCPCPEALCLLETGRMGKMVVFLAMAELLAAQGTRGLKGSGIPIGREKGLG